MITEAEPPVERTRLSMRVPRASSAVTLADASDVIAEVLEPTVAVRDVMDDDRAVSAVVLAVVSAVTKACAEANVCAATVFV
jgi:hypothetical protein